MLKSSFQTSGRDCSTRHGFSTNHDKARLRTFQTAEETTVRIGNDALPMFDLLSCDTRSPKTDHHFAPNESTSKHIKCKLQHT
jgi:hypothetical protein